MSEFSEQAMPTPDHNLWQSWRGSPLARTVHAASLVVQISVSMLLTPMVGCVIPPSLEVDNQDAGINSAPAIVAVSSDQQALSEPGPVTFEMGSTASDLRVSLVDTDTRDILYVRIFVDYNFPNRLDARARCQAPPSRDPSRTVTCKLNSLCLTEDLGVRRNMTVVVFDREPLGSEGDPPFQGMLPGGGGLSSNRFYFLNCQPPQL